MTLRRKAGQLPDKVELNMTPMIDIVFQLLTFFLLTLRIANVEGDFFVKMPLASAEGPPTDPLPAMKVRLAAGAKGELAGTFVNGRRIAAAELRTEAIRYAGDLTDPGRASAAEVEFDADPTLHYQHIMDAITQVSGYKTAEGKSVKLIERIKFGKRS